MRHIPTWLPIASFKRKALEARKAVEAMLQVPYDLVKTDMVSIRFDLSSTSSTYVCFQQAGKAESSYVSTLIEKLTPPEGQLPPEDEWDIQGSAGTLYAGE